MKLVLFTLAVHLYEVLWSLGIAFSRSINLCKWASPDKLTLKHFDKSFFHEDKGMMHAKYCSNPTNSLDQVRTNKLEWGIELIDNHKREKFLERLKARIKVALYSPTLWIIFTQFSTDFWVSHNVWLFPLHNSDISKTWPPAANQTSVAAGGHAFDIAVSC